MSDLPSTSEPETILPDDSGALQRAAASIREAHDAEGRVAASGDITSEDESRADDTLPREDPDGAGGH